MRRFRRGFNWCALTLPGVQESAAESRVSSPGVAHPVTPRTFAWAVVAIFAISLLVLSAGPARAAFPGGNGSLIFGNSNVVSASDLSGAITSYGVVANDAALSPDGTQLAFSNFQSGHCDLMLLGPAGLSQITNSTGCDYRMPSWSPDGTRLVFVRLEISGRTSLGTIDVNGSNETTLVPTSPPHAQYNYPVWSPDGQKIAFSGGTSVGGNDIDVVNADGTNLTNLTQTTEGIHRYIQPDWAPDSSQLVFVQNGAGQEGWVTPGIWMINANGTNLHPVLLSACSASTSGVVWSPDGSKLGYSQNTTPCGAYTPELFTMNTDGSNRQQITHTGGTATNVSDWRASPPGGPVSVPAAPPAPTSLSAVRGFDVASDGTFVLAGVLAGQPDGGQPDLFLSPPAGGLTPLTFDGLPEYSPSIADNHQVVYSPGGQLIVLRNGDGSGRVALTPASSSCGYAGTAIAPDASFVVYSSYCDGTHRIAPDGTNDVPLTPSNIDMFAADVSPNGAQVAGQCSDQSTSVSGICTVASDGSGFAWAVTSTADTQWQDITWSPDGTKLASFANTSSTGASDLYVFAADGSSPRLVSTPGADYKQSPRWLADGRIAYIDQTSTDGSTTEIRYVSLSDANGDGIADALQPAGTPAGSFANVVSGKTNPTTGTLVRGSVAITDVADPTKGVRVTAVSDALLSVCGPPAFMLELSAGMAATVTCSSVIIENVTGASGSVTVKIPGGLTSVKFPAGTAGTVNTTASGGATVTSVNGLGITLTTGGNTTAVGAMGLTLILGRSGNDKISGTPGDDMIVGNGGNDTINGLGGNDTIITGSGNDIIDGGDGNDSVDAGSGTNLVNGSTGNDTIKSGSGSDVISGAAGNDTIDAGSGNNAIDGGAGNDDVKAGSGNDLIIGGDGNDTLNAGAGNNVVNGNAGTDTITTGPGNDSIDGGAGPDTCTPGGGKDTIKNCETIVR